MPPRIERISLSPSGVTRVLGLVAGLLLLASVAGQFSRYFLGHDHVKGLVPLFDVDREENVPTWFSVLLLLAAAQLLALVASSARRSRERHAWKWAILSAGFVVMSFDEAFSVHETWMPPLRDRLGRDDLGFLYFAWVVPGLAIVAAVGLVFLGFLLQLPRRTRRGFLLAASLYLGGALGFEMIGGRYIEPRGEADWTFSLITTVEEGLEMAGLVAFLHALLAHCADRYGELRVGFAAGRGSVASPGNRASIRPSSTLAANEAGGGTSAEAVRSGE